MRIGIVAALGLVAVVGCKNEEIHVYRVAKEPAAAAAPAGDMGMAGGPDVGGSASHDLKWKLPEGWVSRPASAMRVASFAAAGPNGFDADISVVSLGGNAGGDLANVNRWRSQIGLAPLNDDAQLDRSSTKIRPGGRPMRLIDFVSADAVIEGKRKSRVIAAIHVHDNTTWFFKMTGEEAATAALKPSFLEFLASIDFGH